MPVAIHPPGLRVELLGLPSFIDTDGRRRLLERKAAALLALLVFEGVRTRGVIAPLLWPDATSAQARNSLRQRLFQLNQVAGAALISGQEELHLAEEVSIDLFEALDLLEADAEAAAGGLLDSVDYDDLPEFGEWLRAARVRWRQRRTERLNEVASRLEAEQRFDLALGYALRLLVEDPLLEQAHRRVMRLHYLLDDRGAALTAFERCRDELRRELGLNPDRETAALAETIRRSGSPAMPARPGVTPVSVLRPPQLIGRDAPRSLLARAAAERSVVVVQGDPGIGKSRLLEDVAAARPSLLASGGRIGDARVPFALLARVLALGHARWPTAVLPDWSVRELARLVPEWGDPPEARLDPLRVRQAFAAALAAWSKAGLEGLLIDDIHHGDEASLECLIAVASDGRTRLAWLVGTRSTEMPAVLGAWLDVAALEGTAVDIRLEPLDGEAMAALVDSLALEGYAASQWAEPLLRHSGGNPLFALETLRALIALGAKAPPADATRLPVPVGLDALLARRLGERSEAALKLVRVAALAGADFDADVAAAVLDAHPLDIVAPWRELEAAQLLSAKKFSHDLIAEAVLRGLPNDIARVLHGRTAVALAQLGRSAARVAPHWAAAEIWDRAGDAFVTAAREARGASRRSDEVALWDRAAESFDRAGQAGMAFDARAASVEGVVLTRGIEAATRLVDRLDSDQRTEPQRMRALTSLACVHLMGGRAKEAESAARSAFEAATQLAAQWPCFEAARLLAVALAQMGRADEALAAIEPFRQLVTTEGDLDQRHNFWSDYAYALKAAQRINDTAEALREALRTAEEAGDQAELATLTSNLALVEGNLGRVEKALEHARQARSLADPLGVAAGPPAGAIELYVSVHAGALGHYNESLAGFERAKACFAGNAGTIWGGLAANHLAHVLTHLGQFARAGQALQWVGAATPATEARRAMLQHRIDRVLRRRSAVSLAQAIDQLAGRDTLMRLLLAIESSLLLPAAEGAAACAAVREEAEQAELLGIGMRARLVELVHRGGTGALAAADVQDFVDRLDRCHPADTYLGEAWWVAFCTLDALGDSCSAEAALRRGHGWVAERLRVDVAPEFAPAFIDRNPVNRDLLAAAGRRLGLRTPYPITAQ